MITQALLEDGRFKEGSFTWQLCSLSFGRCAAARSGSGRRPTVESAGHNAVRRGSMLPDTIDVPEKYLTPPE